MIFNVEFEDFKLFKKQLFFFHPEFNLIAGVNGSGKSSVLKGLAIALAGWAHAYIKGESNLRPILDNEVREIEIDGRFDLAKHTRIVTMGEFPVINRYGTNTSGKVTWTRDRLEDFPITMLAGSIQYKHKSVADSYSEKSYQLNFDTLGRDILQYIERGRKFNLPVIAFYECDRLWMSNGALDLSNTAKKKYSRFEPYLDCFHTGSDDAAISEWLLKLELEELQRLSGISDAPKNPIKSAMEIAVQGALENCTGFRFDFAKSRVMVSFENGKDIAFEHLSDGQKTVLGLFCDIAKRAAILNPHLEENVCFETTGVVLIDELDLHLHPKWQKNIVENLRATFPCIQFICTTHSPFIIQSIRDSEELILLDGDNLSDYGSRGVEEISRNMGVSKPEVSNTYDKMKGDAHAFLETLDELDEQKLSPEEFHEKYKEKLAALIAPYADNPAYQAILERKYATKIGFEL
ncbi:AAA family ATPase [Marinomonas foliarum]|uniref:Putative ATP-binding protein involved in virulence n=1 Tax=Marinomonas foliarum TaxID=491950 RepID=A0A368ZC24_9GAMM|nr:AAA family ATPase [Marinomonas foliarum]RCW90498.1 putative ATP-binding protein involved in virulence [Marinomonas foliarum]